ncbi:ferredoxin C 2, chloroplastic isoform X2 [Typha latifolia]|uniref:ferredoxin C 2, chloroplastic isoform X2 n=1 Tax=Typha latifolia TaxID=4733 RepID=UPI003C2DE5D9
MRRQRCSRSPSPLAHYAQSLFTGSLSTTVNVESFINSSYLRINTSYTLPNPRTYPFPLPAAMVLLLCCCTSCAVRIKSGQIRQPEALGISAELRSKGYALLCVGFPSSDIEVETQDEDEVYWLQFGRYFARGPIERDDYALELAMGDE